MSGGETEVLARNEAFYDAFNARDMDAMDHLWAEQAPVVCLHPGSAALHGRSQVIRSWHSILASESAPNVTIDGARVVMLGETAMVLCYERVTDRDSGTGAVLAATNVFVRESGAWRLVHHHASAIGRIVADSKTEPRTLN
ncbi:MAG TPA: nuclear transport factor 2 family protein [Polyangiaceae bacterium]|jgi:ketosteroid isomerase-like protein